MGKVYEAVKRAERVRREAVNGNVSGISGISDATNGAGSGNRNGALTGSNLAAVPAANVTHSTPRSTPAGGEQTESADGFDFLDYALSALPAEQLAERHQEIATANFARRALVEARREVTLDAARLDPQLTMLLDGFADGARLDANPFAAEQYNKLIISMIAEKEARPLRKILIASTHRGEGRSCVALNLAAALARARQRVLVIDADLQRPSLLRLLGVEAHAGLTDVLGAELPPAEATVRLLPAGFSLLPTREPVANPTELLTSPRLREVLTLLEAEYDFLLFDSSPLLRVNDANLLARLTNATVYVIRAGKTSSLQLGKAIASLTEEQVFGVVLNRAEDWLTR